MNKMPEIERKNLNTTVVLGELSKKEFPLRGRGAAFFSCSLYSQEKCAGQSLVEAMVAIGIIVFGVLATLGLLSRALSLNRVVSDQFTATYLAAEGIEVVKNLIDANVIQGRPWNSGFTTGSFEADYNSLSLESNQGRRLLLDLASGHYSYDAGNPTFFVRTINIELIGSEEIKVSPVVAWRTRGGGNFEVRLEDHFFNWR